VFAGLGGLQIEELAPEVSPAAHFGDAIGEQRLVTVVVVDNQVTAELTEEAPGVFAAATGTEVEQGYRRRVGRGVREEVSASRLAGAGIAHGNRCFVGMQHWLAQQFGLQSICSGISAKPVAPTQSARWTSPVQHRCADRSAAAIQRQMVGIFADEHVRSSRAPRVRARSRPVRRAQRRGPRTRQAYLGYT
jgi:hypothetical protein